MSLDFQRLEQVLAEAAAKADPAERAAYLAEACGEDQELRTEVERLLAAYEKAGDFLETPVCPVRNAEVQGPNEGIGLASELTEQPGAMIGRYKLLEEIGEGAFGVVYMAEQQEPVQRKVALKIVKAGMDTREVIARFEAERQALALMDHPNIAQVFDGGVTQAGRPYFVMELVPGIAITDFCDQRNLATPERLQLFIQVCHAVQHAHQKGIIHRDLKPSNILVTLMDGEPVPKVIDFGVAKALGRKLTDKTLFTGFLKMIGTPAYMSPEQADLSGVDIDTRADIYALGVLLYELLTGVTPFDGETLRNAALDEIRHLIRETEPAKPSTRLHTLGERLNEVAKHRQIEPAELRRLVRGDLDWIVMRALEKDRRRRYETANNLAADVERHLNHESVLASPPGSVYRARKFIRRHRLGVASAAAIALALAGGLSFSTWMFLRERRARQQMEVRAYVSDMASAMRTAAIRDDMGGVVKLLAAWEDYTPDLRGWEWYYLNGLCHREILTIQAETNELRSVSWSPDGTRLATGGAEGAVKIWDALSGRQLACLRGHTGEVTSVAWSPDGRRLASSGADTTVRLWNLETGSETLTLRGQGGKVFSVAWSPDGMRLASGGRGKMVRIWDPLSGANTQTLPVPNTVLSLSWMSDGTRLAAAGYGEWVSVWDLPSGKKLWGDEGSGDKGAPLFCAWSPDGTELATGGNGGSARIRDAATGTRIMNVGPGGPFSSIAWAPRGRRLAGSTYSRGVIKVWDTASGQSVQSFFGHVGEVRCVSWCPDAARIASAGLDGTVKVWDTSRPESSVTLLKQPKGITRLAWHPDGSRLALRNRSSVWVLDLAQPTHRVELPGGGSTIAWNPAGTRLACGDSDGVLRVWDPVSRTEIWHGQVSGIRSAAWSPDSRRLASTATTDINGRLNVWDAATGKQVSSFPLRGARYLGVAWSPDGSRLAVGVGKDIQILDAVSGKERHLLKGHADDVRSLAWSPDSKRLASGAADASVRIWDASSGRETQTLLGHAGPITEVAWHPDGNRLVSIGGGDKSLIIWGPTSGSAICSIGQDEWSPLSVAWSPDGARLASSDGSGMVRILDSTPGRNQPEKAAERRRRLASALMRESPEGVARAVERVLNMEPPDAPAELLKYAEYLILAGEHARAIELLGRTDRRPDNVDLQLTLGRALLASGRKREARAAFEKVIASFPNWSPRPPVRASIAHWTAAYFLDLVTMEQFAKRCRDHPQVKGKYACWPWFFVGERMEIEGKVDEAIAAYRKSVELGKLPEAHYIRNWSAYRLHVLTGEPLQPTTRPASSQPVAFDEGLWSSRGAAYLKAGQWAEAVRAYSRAIEIKPDYTWFYHERGFCYFHMGQFQEMLADYTRATELSPRDPDNWVRRGWAHVRLSQPEEAVADYAKAIDCFKQDDKTVPTDLLRQLADLLIDLKRFAEAEVPARECVAIRRKQADGAALAGALATLTLDLLEQGKLADAEAPARECLAIREKRMPDNWLVFNARSLLGGSLLGQKKYAEAEPLLVLGYEGMKQREDQIPAGSTRLKEALQRLVQLYEATGRPEKAAEWRQKLTEIDNPKASNQAGAP